LCAQTGYVDDKLFDIIGADETKAIAQYEMALIPPIPSDAVVHDIACGLGPVTESILATGARPREIIATDLAPPMTSLYNNVAEAHSWPSRATVMDCQKLHFPDGHFTHNFLSFGLPIIADPTKAASELYRTLQPGGTCVTAFWLQIPQGENAQETRAAIWGPDAHLAMEPRPRHKDRDYLRELLVGAGFKFEDVELHEKSAFLPVKDLHEFARAIWSAIGQPRGGWTQEDEERWDEAVDKYKELLQQKRGFHVGTGGKVTLEAIAQVAIVKKRA
ncbi:hypothetical protein SLS62_010926, partial [Diatrype stigma]